MSVCTRIMTARQALYRPSDGIQVATIRSRIDENGPVSAVQFCKDFYVLFFVAEN